jgi:YrbI family 3-deoxy-D-manno-octulosonate 8-phosphate phosphatase
MDGMVKGKEVLAIIPARGGSKGIPRKNIRSFAGYPLISYSIAAAKQSQLVTRTVLSTDDEEIAAVGRQYGADVPCLRPAEFAQDQTLDLPVYQHMLGWLEEHEGYKPEVVVQLRPTSPIRPRSMVDDAVKLLLDHPEADSVRGVVPAGQNPHKMWRIDQKSGQMTSLLKVDGVAEPYNAPRQVLPPVYWQTGHIDAIRPEIIMKKNTMSGDVILPLMVEPRFTVDLDNLWDWQRAEWLAYYGGLDMVFPGQARRPLPEKIELVVFDFDGVLTDNRVWVNQEGYEMIAANRSDSMGINRMRRHGVEAMVISTEINPVVSARCRKMNVPVLQGIQDKVDTLKGVLKERNIDPRNVVFVGNDFNDTPCFPMVGCAVVVADAELEAIQVADLVLTRRGGHGAAREISDLILKQIKKE